MTKEQVTVLAEIESIRRECQQLVGGRAGKYGADRSDALALISKPPHTNSGGALRAGAPLSDRKVDTQ